MKEALIMIVLIIIVTCSIMYIIKQKKKGNKCIGCPFSATCQKNKNNCN